MNKDEFPAHVVFEKMQKRQALQDEFERLRPNWRGSFIRSASTLIFVAILLWLYPEIIQQPVLYVFLILVVAVSSEIHAESKRIHHRLDTLHRLLKDDV